MKRKRETLDRSLAGESRQLSLMTVIQAVDRDDAQCRFADLLDAIEGDVAQPELPAAHADALTVAHHADAVLRRHRFHVVFRDGLVRHERREGLRVFDFDIRDHGDRVVDQLCNRIPVFIQIQWRANAAKASKYMNKI